MSAYDGDTVTLALDVYPDWSIETAVRIHGIDAPEIRGECDSERELARAARDAVRELLEDAGRITVRIQDVGKYGRPIGQIWTDGKNLALELLERDLAREYLGGHRPGWC